MTFCCVAVRLRWLLGAALDAEIDEELQAIPFEIPSIESDVWGYADFIDPTEPRVKIPAIPDGAVAYQVQVSWTTEAGDVGWTSFQDVADVGELVVTARQVQWRIVLTRATFPYLPALRGFAFAATA